MRKIGVACSAAIAALWTSAAAATCSTRGGSFYVTQNDSVTYYANCDARGGAFNFRSGGRAQFTSASIQAGARAGKLTQTGPFAFSYRPNAGFKGADGWVIRICGRTDSGSGCSTLTYQTTVQ